MLSRHRERFRSTAKGSIARYTAGVPTVEGPFPYLESDAWINDYVGKTKNEYGMTPVSPLVAISRKVNPPTLSCRFQYEIRDFPEVVMNNVPGLMPDATGSISAPPEGWLQIEPTTNQAVAKLLANSNPFRYSISVPVMVLELAEASSLLKVGVSSLLSLFGSAYLNWTFGWEQTMRDIKTLANITKTIEDRVKEFNDLISTGGSRRKVFISSRSTGYSQPYSTHVSNDFGAWGGPVDYVWKSKVWGSVTWRPQRNKLLEVEQLTSFNSAVQHVLDLDSPDPSTVWEAIPFSWLVDYFVNVGDQLKAVENTDLVIPSDVCIMRERSVTTIADWKVTPSDDGWPNRSFSTKPGKVEILMKNRECPEVGGVSDLLHFGFMNQKQSINLIALLASLKR